MSGGKCSGSTYPGGGGGGGGILKGEGWGGGGGGGSALSKHFAVPGASVKSSLRRLAQHRKARAPLISRLKSVELDNLVE